jgi:hypothetical protein
MSKQQCRPILEKKKKNTPTTHSVSSKRWARVEHCWCSSYKLCCVRDLLQQGLNLMWRESRGGSHAMGFFSPTHDHAERESLRASGLPAFWCGRVGVGMGSMVHRSSMGPIYLVASILLRTRPHMRWYASDFSSAIWRPVSHRSPVSRSVHQWHMLHMQDNPQCLFLKL